MKLKDIREKVNSGIWFGTHEKLTVIKRDGKVVVRLDMGSPRNSNLSLDRVNSQVRRTLNVETTPNLYKGSKGIYSNYWAEAIIEESNEAE